MPEYLTIEGKRFVVIPDDEWLSLNRAARLPALPEPDEEATIPQSRMHGHRWRES
jgi:hypothetical protein